jgi:GC-rich sequence DNA-binding factor
MRTTGSISSRADEYISLSLTTRDDEYRGPHPESRLMREDDDLGQGDDGVFIQPTIFLLG